MLNTKEKKLKKYLTNNITKKLSYKIDEKEYVKNVKKNYEQYTQKS